MPTAALPSGFHDTAPGTVSTIVTHLEMTEAPDNLGTADATATLDRLTGGETDRYLRLFRAVGEDWLWFSRLRMPKADLAAILSDPLVEAYAVTTGDGPDLGLLELDFRSADSPELAFFGLTPAATGQGLGRWLMDRALALAWARPIPKLTVHTCTLDSPVALPFYLRSGFRAVRREVEIAPDPRLTGDIPASSGAHIPIIR